MKKKSSKIVTLLLVMTLIASSTGVAFAADDTEIPDSDSIVIEGLDDGNDSEQETIETEPETTESTPEDIETEEETQTENPTESTPADIQESTENDDTLDGQIQTYASTSTAKATNLKQTDADTTYVEISFKGVSGTEGYYVYYSTDKSSWKRIDGSTSAYPDVYDEEAFIDGLKAGKAYYVKVVPVFDDYETGADSSILQVVTAPKAITGLKQTGATKSSITLSWTKASGATGYYVKNSSGKTVKKVTTNKAKISVSAGKIKDYEVYSYKKSSAGYIAENDIGKYKCAYSAPGKVKNLASVSKDYIDWNVSSNRVCVYWDENSKDEYYPDGFQVQIYKLNGKTKIKTYKTTYGYKSFKLSKVKNRGFKIRVRGYKKINGKKYYGAWSSKKAIVPLAKVKSVKQTGNKTATVKWKKVKNATKYTIYVSKNTLAKKPKWKKVATVSKKKTSYKIKNLKTNEWAGVYVVPTVKSGSKKYKAVRPQYRYTDFYMYKYY